MQIPRTHVKVPETGLHRLVTPVLPLGSWDTKTGDCLGHEAQIAAWNKRSRFKQGCLLFSMCTLVAYICSHTPHMHIYIPQACFVSQYMLYVWLRRILHSSWRDISASVGTTWSQVQFKSNVFFFLIHSVEY